MEGDKKESKEKEAPTRDEEALLMASFAEMLAAASPEHAECLVRELLHEMALGLTPYPGGNELLVSREWRISAAKLVYHSVCYAGAASKITPKRISQLVSEVYDEAYRTIESTIEICLARHPPEEAPMQRGPMEEKPQESMQGDADLQKLFSMAAALLADATEPSQVEDVARQMIHMMFFSMLKEHREAEGMREKNIGVAVTVYHALGSFGLPCMISASRTAELVKEVYEDGHRAIVSALVEDENKEK